MWLFSVYNVETDSIAFQKGIGKNMKRRSRLDFYKIEVKNYACRILGIWNRIIINKNCH